jgi:multiple sugar transport system permease protein
MSNNSLFTGVVYTIGTVLTWVGIVYALRAVTILARMITNKFDSNPIATRKSLFVSLMIAFVGIASGFILVMPLEEGNIRIPLVWFVMPWSAWLCAGLLLYSVARAVNAWQSITDTESRSHLIASGCSVIGAVVFGGMYFLDDKNKIEILRGGIVTTPLNLGLMVMLALIAVGLMVFTANSVKAKGLGKTIIMQATLLAGSVVFGLPFLFLLITSFKEDRDMSSKSGIIWVPKVTNTVPFMNPNPAKKHFETEYDGRVVEGLIIGEENGQVKIDIFKPMAIRGVTFLTTRNKLKEVPVEAKVYTAKVDGKDVTGFEEESLADGSRVLQVTAPNEMKGKRVTLTQDQTEPVRHVGLRYQNYTEALDYLPPETLVGLVYLKNTLILVVMGVIGTLLSSSLVAYAFSRMQFPAKEKIFRILLATMMLPGAVTLLPQFLIFRSLGWIDTLYPLWVPAFFGGSAFNIFLLRQFFSQIPMELEDAAKVDGCTYLRTFWEIMIPQIKPALAVIAIWTFMGAWNNFMGPLIYVNSPENMPISYALALFKGDRANEPGLLMAFSTLTVVPVVALFAFAQKYFIEGVTLSGLGGR